MPPVGGGQPPNNPFAQLGQQFRGGEMGNAASIIGGAMSGQFQPVASVHDQAMANRLNLDQWQAIQRAGQLDRPYLTRLILGAMTLSGGQSGESQQQLAARAARLAEFITTNASGLSPELIDQIGGRQGLAANLARGVTDGLRFTRYGTRDAGAFAEQLHGDLYGQRQDQNGQNRLRDLNGLSANSAGGLFSELAQRGLLPMTSDRAQMERLLGEMTSDNTTVAQRLQQGQSLQTIVASDPRLQNLLRGADVRRAADLVENWSGAVAAARDLLQNNGRPNASMPELFHLIEELTQGSAAGMNPGNVQMQIRRAHQIIRNTPGGLQRYLMMVRQGGALAESAGADRSLGAQTAAMSSAFGNAFGRLAGRQGPGGLNRDEASQLDQQLRTAAATSPMANLLGAIMALDADGMIRRPPGTELVQAIRARNMERLSQLTRLTPRQARQLLVDSGVSDALAGQYLQARDANQAFVTEHGLQDIVRQMQGQGEIAQLMRSGLQSGMGGVLREAGLSREEGSRVRQLSSEAARQALMGMDGEMLADPARRQQRHTAVADAIEEAIGPEMRVRLGRGAIRDLAAASVRGLEGAMERNPGLRRFRNVAGLVSMNRGDVFSGANQDINRADAQGQVSSALAGLGQAPPLARIADALAGAGPDTRTSDLITQALGGISNAQIAVALTPIFEEIRAGRNVRANVDAALEVWQQSQLQQLATASAAPAGGAAPAGAGPAAGPATPGAQAEAAGLGWVPGLAMLRSPADFQASRLDELQRRDSEVRLQETLHHRIAGQHAVGPPQYTFRTGPDGRPYAIGGHVMLDVSPVRGDPAATAAKMSQIRRAALAPSRAGGAAGHVSADDAMVAARAAQQSPMQLSSPASPWPSTGGSPRQSPISDWAGMAAVAGERSSQPMRITGTLTIREDGQADFDAFPNTMGSPPSASSF